MENCVFCKIIRGEIQAAKVWESESHLAFLTIDPINPGHTLVIPKKHISYIFDMEDADLGQLMAACKPIARALKQTYNPTTGKIGVMVAGGEVPHVHIHLVPMSSEAELNFALARHNVPLEELQREAEKIKTSSQDS